MVSLGMMKSVFTDEQPQSVSQEGEEIFSHTAGYARKVDGFAIEMPSIYSDAECLDPAMEQMAQLAKLARS